jgi:hypothetical protein
MSNGRRVYFADLIPNKANLQPVLVLRQKGGGDVKSSNRQYSKAAVSKYY